MSSLQGNFLIASPHLGDGNFNRSVVLMVKHDEDGAFGFAVNAERVAAEAALDGIYVIRTNVADEDMSAEKAVLNYKKLADVERAFRTLKGVDLHVRPIRHRLEGHTYPL